MNHLLRAIGALVICLLLGACQLDRQAPADPRFTVVLIDQSETMAAYQEQQFAQLVNIACSLRGGDAMEIYAVTENPLSSPDPISIVIPAYDRRRFNPITYRSFVEKEILDQGIAALEAAKQRIFDQKLTPDTAIVDSLEVAARAFRSSAGRAAHHRDLVLLSDMWEDQRGKIRFPRETLTDQRITELLDRIETENHLPDLTGVEVWVAGARIHRDSPRDFEDGVERFWLAAFSRMGANAPVERFAPSLRDFATNQLLVRHLNETLKSMQPGPVAARTH